MKSIFEKLNIQNIQIDKDPIFNNDNTKTLKDYTEFKDWSPNTFNIDIRAFIKKYFKPNKKVYVLIINDNDDKNNHLIGNHRRILGYSEYDVLNAKRNSIKSPASTAVSLVYDDGNTEIFISPIDYGKLKNTIYYLFQK